MNIIFLDIDGVLNNSKYRGDSIHDHKGWDQNCLNALEYIINNVEKLGFVLSSTWRMLYTLKEMEQMFIERIGYSPNFVGITPLNSKPDQSSGIYISVTRGQEIAEWLADNDIDDYIIIDDDRDMLPNQLCHFVKTSFHSGLTMEHARRIVKYFSQPQVGCLRSK